MTITAWFRLILGIIGVVLIALPFLPFNLLPTSQIISLLSNNTLSIIAGSLLVIFAFWLWRMAIRRKMMLYGQLYRYPS
jgi:hypothetical protein